MGNRLRILNVKILLQSAHPPTGRVSFTLHQMLLLGRMSVAWRVGSLIPTSDRVLENRGTAGGQWLSSTFILPNSVIERGLSQKALRHTRVRKSPWFPNSHCLQDVPKPEIQDRILQRSPGFKGTRGLSPQLPGGEQPRGGSLIFIFVFLFVCFRNSSKGAKTDSQVYCPGRRATSSQWRLSPVHSAPLGAPWRLLKGAQARRELQRPGHAFLLVTSHHLLWFPVSLLPAPCDPREVVNHGAGHLPPPRASGQWQHFPPLATVVGSKISQGTSAGLRLGCPLSSSPRVGVAEMSPRHQRLSGAWGFHGYSALLEA